MRCEPFWTIQKCPQRKALGTSELPRGAFTQPHMQQDPPGSLFMSKPKPSPSRHRRRVKNQAPGNALRALFAHPKMPPKGRLWVQENSPGEPLRSPTCNWTLRVRFFRATLNISLAGIGEDCKHGSQKTRCKPLWTIQKCHQKKALGTSELPRGAFTQPHMQLDPPGSLFMSKRKRIPSRHRRRVKNQAPGNALRAG